MATLSIKQRFNSIKQDKISDQAKKALQLMKEATDNFKDEEAVAKIRPKFDALFEKIKIAKPEAIKGEPTKETKKAPTPSQTKSVRSAASSLSLTAKKRILEAKKERARQAITTKKADILKDGKIKAIKKTGRRISQGLKGNQFKDKSEAKGNVYYEYRNNRYDKRPDSKPRLEKGGMMAKGGELSKLNKGDKLLINFRGEQTFVTLMKEPKEGRVVHYVALDKNGKRIYGHPSLMEYDEFSNSIIKKMASGGMMAEGGEIGEGFYIRDMKQKLSKMFPDSFGFTVGNFSKEGDLFKNSSALIVDTNSPFNGLQDSEIKSRLFFPQYKRDHDIRFRIYQGGENTYFYFVLESENGDQYIGQFGFKDEGDVSSDYITRFIAFLMEQYGLPFEVKHSVMAKGGYMAGGEMHRVNEG